MTSKIVAKSRTELLLLIITRKFLTLTLSVKNKMMQSISILILVVIYGYFVCNLPSSSIK